MCIRDRSVKDREIEVLRRQLQDKVIITVYYIAYLIVSSYYVQERQAKSTKPLKQKNLTLKWEEKTMVKCGFGMIRGAACVIKTMATFNPIGSPFIYCFDYCSKKWSILPQFHMLASYFALVVINDLLTTVGGTNSNKLFSFSKGKWVEKFPPMPTKRQFSAAVCTGHSLVVAGGQDEDERALPTVEVMDIKTLQWFTAARLPRGIHWASMTACGNDLYLLGDDTTNVYSCSLQALLQTCQAPGKASTSQQASVWNRIADLPVKRSTAATLCGQLVSVGGNDEKGVQVNSVYCYDPATTTWKITGQIPACRSYPLITTLAEDKLIIVYGGLYVDVTIDIASATMNY